MKSKRKKSNRKKLVQKLDDACALAVKLRDDYTCQYCGQPVKGRNCHWAHVIGGRGYFLRWDLVNSLVLCFHHHIQGWHGGLVGKDTWFKDKFRARWNYLHGCQNNQNGVYMPRNNIVWKFTDNDLEELLAKLNQKVRDLKGE